VLPIRADQADFPGSDLLIDSMVFGSDVTCPLNGFIATARRTCTGRLPAKIISDSNCFVNIGSVQSAQAGE
jgi:hypothetical protein